MSYDKISVDLAVTPASNANLTAANLLASAADWAVFNVHHPIQVRRISFFVSTAVTATTTAPVVSVFSRPTSASSSSQATIGTLVIPSGTAVGKVVYKELESVRVKAGYDLAIAVTTQGTGGGSGAGFGGIVYEYDPEAPANQSNMIASA